MGHPFRDAARKSAKPKLKNMIGTSKGAKHMNDDSVVNPNATVSKGIEDVKIMGHPPQKRLDRASGGKVKGATVVNVIVKGGDSEKAPLPPLPMPPPMPPVGAGPPPPMGRPPMPPPGGPPPGMMMRKQGGGVKAGAGSGVGRLNRQNKLNIKGK